MICEVEHVKSTTPFKWHNGGVTVSTMWNVNIKWELPNKGSYIPVELHKGYSGVRGTQNATEPNSIRGWQSK